MLFYLTCLSSWFPAPGHTRPPWSTRRPEAPWGAIASSRNKCSPCTETSCEPAKRSPVSCPGYGPNSGRTPRSPGRTSCTLNTFSAVGRGNWSNSETPTPNSWEPFLRQIWRSGDLISESLLFPPSLYRLFSSLWPGLVFFFLNDG